MYDLSILISSNRPEQCINTINQINDKIKLNYEILVYSPFEINLPNVKWTKETVPSPIYGYNQLANYSQGKIISGLSDTINIPESYNSILDVSHNIFSNRQLKVYGIHSEGGDTHIHHNTGVDVNIIRFPVFDRLSLLNDFGGFFFNPSFFYHVADNWLGLWCYLMGEPTIESQKIIISSRPHEYINHHDELDLAKLFKLQNNFYLDKSYSSLI